MSIEIITPQTLEKTHALTQLSERALWVCFLNYAGYETFAPATYDGRGVYARDSTVVPKDAEVSSVQFWDDQTQVTVIPTGRDNNGVLEFHTVEQLTDIGSLPEITAHALAKRIRMQPYNRHDPKSPIYPLVALAPLNQLIS